VHLFGFIIRIYHDARSPEHQIFYMLYKVVFWIWLVILVR